MLPEQREIVKVKDADLAVGKELLWPVFDKSGQLLLRKGAIITTERQVEMLLERGLYRIDFDEDEEHSLGSVKNKPSADPFSAMASLIFRLEKMFSAVQRDDIDDLLLRTAKLGKAVQILCESDSDATLGAIHLDHDGAYTVVHSLNCALLSELLAKRLGISPRERLSIVCAALTSNIGMLRLQESLQAQDTPLTDEQKKGIEDHPQKAIDILKKHGVKDELWLKCVYQHHERIDGSGYPEKLSGDEIVAGARIIALTDSYHAMLAPRIYRSGYMPREALREMMVTRGKLIDETFAHTLIKEIGVPPPGAYVRLASGETAVIIKRGQGEDEQMMASAIIGKSGDIYMDPRQRDCSDPAYAIKEMFQHDNRIRISLMKLWGY